MSRGTKFEPEQLQQQLQTIAAVVRALAQSCQGDSVALVGLLRLLEELHREIRDGIFQAALPDNRQALYNLLKDIETEGGWPYIERMRLQAFLANLEKVRNVDRKLRDLAGKSVVNSFSSPFVWRFGSSVRNSRKCLTANSEAGLLLSESKQRNLIKLYCSSRLRSSTVCTR